MLRWDAPLLFEHTALYYERGDYIVHNHHANGWVVVTPDEYQIVSALRRGSAPEALVDRLCEHGFSRESARSLVARVALRLLLYRLAYQGERPADWDPPEEGRRAPSKAFFVCTNRCNLSCAYCYAESGPHADAGDELSTAEALKLIDDVADLGVKSFTFTGGEALTRADIFTLAERVKEHGLTLSLITNGASITPEKAKRIARLFDRVSVSLDSLHPTEHDYYRGPGSHARALRGIELLRNTCGGTRIQINATATDKSAVHFADLADWAMKQGYDFRYSAIAQIGRGESSFGLSLSASKALRNQLRQRAEEAALEKALIESGQLPIGVQQFQTRVHCGHGRDEFSIAPNGDVYPCRLFHQPGKRAGNVRETPLAEIWYRSPVFTDPGYATVDKLPLCSRCTFRHLCGGGCRAGAEGATGDYYGVINAECPSIRRDLRRQMWYYFRGPQLVAEACRSKQRAHSLEVTAHEGV